MPNAVDEQTKRFLDSIGSSGTTAIVLTLESGSSELNIHLSKDLKTKLKNIPRSVQRSVVKQLTHSILSWNSTLDVCVQTAEMNQVRKALFVGNLRPCISYRPLCFFPSSYSIFM